MNISAINSALEDAQSTDKISDIQSMLHDHYSDIGGHLDSLRELDVAMKHDKDMQTRVRDCIQSFKSAQQSISDAIDDLQYADTDIIEDIGLMIDPPSKPAA